MPETPAPAAAPVVEAPKQEAIANTTEQPAAPALTNDVPAPAANAVPAPVANDVAATANDVPAPAANAAPAANTAPAIASDVPAAKPAFVDIRIDSNPAGATAVLVDNGKTSFLGTTPLATSLDPSRQYDIVFTYDDRPTQMAHLDPAKDTRVSITLPKAASSSRHHRAPTPVVAAAPTAKAPAEKPMVAEEGGEGTLMVSSKPPCDIIIDGKPTGLTTPQRSISLAAGVHKVTFVNDAEKIKKTVSVTISADKPTKLIQDLMQR
jgi:hypothetical protein